MEAIMGLATTIRQWQSSWARAHEFAALEQDQREALARDIGLSEDVLAGLVTQGAGAGAELPRLMGALSLDADRVRRTHPALMRDMSVTCSGCAAAARCRPHLDQGLARWLYGLYCPNAETLRELRGERQARQVIA
jgi:hypothetical protein